MVADILIRIKTELESVGLTPLTGKIKTSDVRRVSALVYRDLPDKSKEFVFAVCESLLEQRNWPMKVIAFDFAYRVRKQYDRDTFPLSNAGWSSICEAGATAMISAPMPLAS